MSLSKFEQDVFEYMIRNSPVRMQLMEQLRTALIKEREYSGFGVFIHFLMPQGVEPIKEPLNFEISDTALEIESLEHGAGVILFVRNGYLDMLEFFTYDEPWPDIIGKYEISTVKDSNKLWVSEDGKTIKRQH